MALLSVTAHRWFYRVWANKTSVLGGVLAIVSFSLAHYAGFLMKVPLQIVSVAGVQLANGVTTTFLFYVFFCAVVARVLTSMFQLVVLPILALTDRGVFRKMDWGQQRRFVRSHRQTIKWEGSVWFIVQAFLFILVTLAVYVKFTVTWISGAGLVISMILVVLSGLFRSGFFLQPKPRTFIRKIKTRDTRSGLAASAAFVTITAASIIVAFFLGGMRASLLRDQAPQMIVTKEFTGKAAVIASSETALLLYQKQADQQRYIYSTPEFTATTETKPVFPPIGARQ